MVIATSNCSSQSRLKLWWSTQNVISGHALIQKSRTCGQMFMLTGGVYSKHISVCLMSVINLLSLSLWLECRLIDYTCAFYRYYTVLFGASTLKQSWYLLSGLKSPKKGICLRWERSSLSTDFAVIGSTMALRWILRSCPDLLWNLVQKLLRLRHVRREKCLLSCNGGELQRSDELKRLRSPWK